MTEGSWPGMTAKELGMMVEMADQVGHDGGAGDDGWPIRSAMT